MTTAINEEAILNLMPSYPELSRSVSFDDYQYSGTIFVNYLISMKRAKGGDSGYTISKPVVFAEVAFNLKDLLRGQAYTFPHVESVVKAPLEQLRKVLLDNAPQT